MSTISVPPSRSGQNTTPAPPSHPRPVAWIPPGDMERAAWVSAGKRIGTMSRVSNWWVGDWLRYGAAKWGEKYVLASRITGYDPHSLENMVYVASRFEISLRRENLSWSHHFLVASLDDVECSRWLDLATEHRLSVSDLRIELRAARRGARAETDKRPKTIEEPVGDRAAVLCPQCGFELGSMLQA